MDLTYIILGGAALIFLIIGIVTLLKWRKGSIEIIPEQYSYKQGESVNGTLILRLKKPVQSKKLIVGLVCEKVEKTYSKDKKNHTENEDVLFDFNQIIEFDEKYLPLDYSYGFSIVIPLNVIPKLEGVEGKIINSLQTLTDKTTLFRWYLYGKLECEGVDLYKKVQININ